MKFKQRSIIFVFTIISILFIIPSNVTSAEGNENFVSVGFYAKDENGDPISQAMVSIEWLNNYRMNRLTNEKGLVSVPLKPAQYIITIQHDNYTTIEDEIQISEPTTFTYILEPKDSSDRTKICTSCFIFIIMISIFMFASIVLKLRKGLGGDKKKHSDKEASPPV